MKGWKTAVIALPLLLAACAQGTNQVSQAPKETVGMLAGGALGGLAGSQLGEGRGQIIATGAGAAIGALIGGQIGRSMDEVDRMKARAALTEAHRAPIGQTVSWNNPDTGNRGTYTPVRQDQDELGRLCREYRTTIYVDGKYEEATGVACRQADGSWQMVS